MDLILIQKNLKKNFSIYPTLFGPAVVIEVYPGAILRSVSVYVDRFWGCSTLKREKIPCENLVHANLPVTADRDAKIIKASKWSLCLSMILASLRRTLKPNHYERIILIHLNYCTGHSRNLIILSMLYNIIYPVFYFIIYIIKEKWWWVAGYI